jgi:hypothetical protein
MLMGFLFVGVLEVYVKLTQLSQSFANGLVLPLSCYVMELITLGLLKRCYMRYYYEPKREYINQLRVYEAQLRNGSQPEQSPPTPTLVGDVELAFGCGIALTALMIDSVRLLSMLIEVNHRSCKLHYEL